MWPQIVSVGDPRPAFLPDYLDYLSLLHLILKTPCHKTNLAIVRGMRGASEWPVRVVIVQNGFVLEHFTVNPESNENDHRHGRKAQQTGRRSSHRQRSSTLSKASDEDGDSAIDWQCLYVDTASAFDVVLYRHRDCSRLSKGFWHTEVLDNHSRMGNALDRKYQGDQATTDAANACLRKHLQSINSTGHSTSGMLHQDHTVDHERDWEICGQLHHKVNKDFGHYSLRLSPALAPSTLDHVFNLQYKHMTSGAKRANAANLQPGTTRRCVSTSNTTIKLQHKQDAGSSIDNLRPSIARSISSRQITPVLRRISQICLGETLEDNSRESQAEVRRAISRTTSENGCGDPKLRDTMCHKRKHTMYEQYGLSSTESPFDSSPAKRIALAVGNTIDSTSLRSPF